MNNKVAEAGEAFKRAEANAPTETKLYMNNLGIVAAKAGDRKKAMEYYDKAKVLVQK
jgi:Flp pilus assembly protein TadD